MDTNIPDVTDPIVVGNLWGQTIQTLKYLEERSAEDKEAHKTIDAKITEANEKMSKLETKVEGMDVRLGIIEQWKKVMDFKDLTPRTKVVITFGSIGGTAGLITAILALLNMFHI